MTTKPSTPPAPDGAGEEQPTPTVYPNSGVGTEAVRKSQSLKDFIADATRWREKVEVHVVPPHNNPETTNAAAHWGYEPSKRTHHITIYDNVAECAHIDTSTPDGRAKALAFAERALRHETWHGRMTDRSPRIVDETANLYRVHPRLFNFFEDARIEDAARYYEGTIMGHLRGEPPSMEHSDIPDPITHPLLMFVYLHKCEEVEADLVIARSRWAGEPTTNWRGRDWPTVDLIEWFVQRASRAHTTRHLWAPLREWLEAFGGELPPVELMEAAFNGEGGNDKLPGSEGMPGEVGEGTPNVIGPEAGPETEERGSGDGGGEEGNEHGTGYSNKRKVASSKPGVTNYDGELRKAQPRTTVERVKGLEPFQHSSVDSNGCNTATGNDAPGPCLDTTMTLYRMYQKMVGMTDASRTRTTVSGTRLHLPNVINHSSEAFRRNVHRKGRRRVCVIMDMSGSMGRHFHAHGGAFLAAMHLLRSNRVMDVDIWLSGGGKCVKLPPTIHIDQIRGLAADHGSETIDRTLKAASDDVQSADTVLIYTDGHLTDGDVKAGQWRGRGVDLIGICTTDAGTDTESVVTKAAKLAGSRHAEDVKEAAKLLKATAEQTETLTTKMKEHFSKVIVETTGVRLASRVVQYVLTRP